MISNIVPEYKMLDLVTKAVNFIREDYNGQSDKTQSWLQRVLTAGSGTNRYDVVAQAVEVFINRDVADPKYLEVNLMFNMQREGAPTIHITLPSEQTQTGGNGIGMDEGDEENILIDSTFNGDGSLNVIGSITPVYTRRDSSTYNIVITGDNSNEVILIYRVLKALIIALTPSFSLAGFQNIVLGGQDLQLQSTMVPKNIYMRAITVKVEFEISVPSIFPYPILDNFNAVGTPVEG